MKDRAETDPANQVRTQGQRCENEEKRKRALCCVQRIPKVCRHNGTATARSNFSARFGLASAMASGAAGDCTQRRSRVWWGDHKLTDRETEASQTRACTRKGSARHEWSMSRSNLCLIALGLVLLPGATPQVNFYPTQISIASAPFLSTGMLPFMTGCATQLGFAICCFCMQRQMSPTL